MVVDFPAPFGPRKPSTSPFPKEKEILFTAVKLSKRLVKPSRDIVILFATQTSLPVKSTHTD
jgi:hypothetical protein